MNVNRKTETWLILVLGISFFGGLWALNYWFDNQSVSVNVSIIDNHHLPVLLRDLCIGVQHESGYKIGQCGTINYEAAIGSSRMYKGNYELKVWLGDLNMVGQLLYSERLYLKHKKQHITVRLNNVTQHITVTIANPGILIPEVTGGDVVTILHIK